jgi:spermidine synthase
VTPDTLHQGTDSPPVLVSERDGVRFLHLGGTAVQSAMRLDAPFQLELEYTRAMMGFLLFHRTPRDIALLGLGGGTMAKFMHRYLPDSRVTALEIHPEVVAAARASFLLPADDNRLRVIVGDGVAYVGAHPDSQDALLVDGYGPEGIVESFATPAFYLDCRAMLRPGGVAVFNLWDCDERHPEHIARLAEAFDGHLLRLPAETKANVVAFAFRPPLPDTGFACLAGRAARLEADLRLEFDDFLVRMGYCNSCSESAFLL